jgi:hypothetical protein
VDSASVSRNPWWRGFLSQNVDALSISNSYDTRAGRSAELPVDGFRNRKFRFHPEKIAVGFELDGNDPSSGRR